MVKNSENPDFDKSGATKVAIFWLCKFVKTSTGSIHLFNTLDGEREIRDFSKKTIFVLPGSGKVLVRKLFNFLKEVFTLSDFETVEFISKSNSSIFYEEVEQLLILEKILESILEVHPLPWRLSANSNKILDSKGIIIVHLPCPKAGLSYPELENLIYVAQPEGPAILQAKRGGEALFC